MTGLYSLEDLPVSTLEIKDTRAISNPDEVSSFENELKRENFSETLFKISDFLGDYKSSVFKPENLRIQLKDGEMGSGACVVHDGVAEIVIESPGEEEGVNFISRFLEDSNKEATPEQARNIFYALQTSTALHESTHSLIDSKPGSKLAQYVESHGFKNERNADANLLDEGITYALMAEFAPVVEPIGNIGPRIDSRDTEIAVSRKI